jgi:hypothetical protein
VFVVTLLLPIVAHRTITAGLLDAPGGPDAPGLRAHLRHAPDRLAVWTLVFTALSVVSLLVVTWPSHDYQPPALLGWMVVTAGAAAQLIFVFACIVAVGDRVGGGRHSVDAQPQGRP